MPVTVLLTAKAHPDHVDNIHAALKEALPDTRVYDGFIQIDIYQNADDPTDIVFHEIWETKEHYLAYLNWRTETGVMDALGSMLTGPPSIQYYQRWDV